MTIQLGAEDSTRLLGALPGLLIIANTATARRQVTPPPGPVAAGTNGSET